MLFNIFIYLISLLAAIQEAKSQIIVDPVSCAAYMTSLHAAINEMMELSNAAYIRTDSLTNPATAPRELGIVLETFRVYFGTTTPAIAQTISDRVLRESFLNKYLDN